MPTLYDNFSQVRQYIDQEKPDLASYVTKTELANCGYVTNSVLSSYLPLSGGTLNGNLTLGNTYFLTVGTQRAWKLFEGGTGSGAYICLQANVDAKSFFIRDKYNNNIIQVYNSNAAGNYVKNYNSITYTCNIKPINSNSYTLGTSDSTWSYTYTKNLILNGANIIDTINGMFSYDSSTGTLSITTI